MKPYSIKHRFFFPHRSFSWRMGGEERKRISYHATRTPSLGPLQFLRETAPIRKKINHYKHHIYYHAEARVALFFLMCVVYYQKERLVIDVCPDVQHGTGNAEHGLEACHSSILPRVLDYSFDLTKPITTHTSIIEKTQFYQDNNMTVCLPYMVNVVDRFFEGHHSNGFCRKKAICILNQVSMGVINPPMGLGLFLKTMDHAFHERDSFIRKESNYYQRQAYQTIFKIQQRGTFDKSLGQHGFFPKQAYLDEILIRKSGETSQQMYKRVQGEMLSMPYHSGSNVSTLPLIRPYKIGSASLVSECKQSL